MQKMFRGKNVIRVSCRSQDSYADRACVNFGEVL